MPSSDEAYVAKVDQGVKAGKNCDAEENEGRDSIFNPAEREEI